jgi:hypothetical protein
MNIISHASYNKIMANELEYQGENIVDRVEPLHVFIGSFVYLVDFMVMKNLGVTPPIYLTCSGMECLRVSVIASQLQLH